MASLFLFSSLISANICTYVREKLSVIFCFSETQIVSQGIGKGPLITYHFNLRFWRIYYKKYRYQVRSP